MEQPRLVLTLRVKTLTVPGYGNKRQPAVVVAHLSRKCLVRLKLTTRAADKIQGDSVKDTTVEGAELTVPSTPIARIMMQVPEVSELVTDGNLFNSSM